MKKIDEKELFQHLTGFLKTKGIQLEQGPYTQRLQKGCEILADTVNLSQQAMERAKEQMDKHLEQVRQIIHERTAPKPPHTKACSASAQSDNPASGQRKAPRPKPASSTRKRRK